MTSPASGYRALHESAAWLDLSDRGKIRATGEDRVRLFHAMLSNDVQGLRPGQGNYHFLLNAQGHILGDANLYLFADSILLDVEPEMTGRVLEHLGRYILADDVQLENVTAEMATVALEGPRADEVAQWAGIFHEGPGRPDESERGTLKRAPRRHLEPSGAHLSHEAGAHVETDGMMVARTSATGQAGLRFFLEARRKGDLVARLESRGAVPVTAGEARVVRVENGVPRYGVDF